MFVHKICQITVIPSLLDIKGVFTITNKILHDEKII